MSSASTDTRSRILDATWRLVEERGAGVRMSDIARAAGISRQAVYLHFRTRGELLVATTRHIDEVRDLDARLAKYRTATTGLDQLRHYVEFWGNYVAEIRGVARALLAVRETDDAAAEAWNDRMQALRSGCRVVVDALHRDGVASPRYTKDEATDLFWTLLSIPNWEQLTVECGYDSQQYIEWIQDLAERTLTQP